MGDIVITPSLKLIRVAYLGILLLLIVSVTLYYATGVFGQSPLIVALAPALLLLWPMKRHVDCRFTRLTISGDKLRYEEGIFTRHKRILNLTKVQDVRVDQSFSQRMLGTGNLSLETAGETSQLSMRNVDSPDHVAEDILRMAHSVAP